DYINRGPDSKGVIDFLMENSTRFHFIFLKGNHEIMMAEAKQSTENLRFWLQHGGSETLASYNIGDNPMWYDEITHSHWRFFENTIDYYETDTYIFVHGGMKPGIVPAKQLPYDLFWKKYETPLPYSIDKTLICGHTSRKNGKIADFGHTICIDTFAYGGQWLTCLNVDSKEYLQTNNKGDVQQNKL
ncbi:MAG: metallophosphoesterase, partial [Cyclobacteriaceae bacterium]